MPESEDFGTENPRTCDLCDDEAVTWEDVQSEETGEVATAYLCEEHEEKLRRYNRGEEVEIV